LTIKETHIKDLLVLQPTVFGDHRGYFFESFRKDLLENNGISDDFVQDNQSMSRKGILRGLHFQKPPFEQGKLVQVIKGAVLDVAVDLRQSSPTYGEHYKIELNEKNKTMFWIPPGFGHGFLTLQDETIFAYKCTNYYNHESEGGILWNSPSLNIDWGIEDPVLSDKDKVATSFRDFKTPFK
jgi:dTDP-4-dehydrorhamnose 3,5-epimerase